MGGCLFLCVGGNGDAVASLEQLLLKALLFPNVQLVCSCK